MRNRLAAWFAVLLCASTSAFAQNEDVTQQDISADKLEQIKFIDKQDVEREIVGRVLVQATDGGVLIEDRSETLWNITPAQMQQRTKTDTEYSRLSADERTRELEAELGVQFAVRRTDHYLIVSNAGPAYVEWCGDLLEKFFVGYMDFWAREPDLNITEPTDPLVVIILANKRQFDEFYARDVGQKTQSSFGYYSIQKNRVVLYDFANPGGMSAEDRTAQSLKQVRRAMKDVPFNVATVVHEATHQLAFNTGLHTRYADNPVWLTEGLAMYFETPDFGFGPKWTKIGKPNDWRKKSLKAYASSISADTVMTLTESDERFRQAQTAANAYTESWALMAYLMNRKRTEVMAFIKAHQTKPQLIWDKPDERREMFEQHIGSAEKFEKLMRSYLKRLR